jgi:hypothetical protein
MSVTVIRSGYVFIAAFLAAPSLSLAADPSSVPAPTLRVGDSWVYDATEKTGSSGFSDHRIAEIIERVGSDSVVLGIKPEGAPGDYEDHIMGPDWSKRRLVDGQNVVTTKPFAFPMAVGNTWVVDYSVPQKPPLGVAHFHRIVKVVGWEDITVPAGVFRALKIESNGTADTPISLPSTAVGGVAAAPSGSTAFTHSQRAISGTLHLITYHLDYYSPQVKGFVKSTSEEYNANDVLQKREVSSLVSFKAAASQ